EEISAPIVFNQEDFNSAEEIKVFKKPKETPKPKPVPQKKITDKIVKTDKKENQDFSFDDLSDFLNSTNTANQKPVDIDDVASLNTPEKEENIDPVSIFTVQDAPIFPGCEKYKDNNKRKDCLNKEIRNFIHRRFNADLAAQMGLSGRIQINAQFTVDEFGEITNIKTYAKEDFLAEEAERIISLLPVFQPGKHNDKPVKVIYQLPIILEIQ